MARQATDQQMPDDGPSPEVIEWLATVAFHDIPPGLREHAANIVFRVEDFPDAETERKLELKSRRRNLLGLYRGLPLPKQGARQARGSPDMIFLYRRALLDYCRRSGIPLADIVRHVLIHEIGHHFGFSDDDMERLDRGG